MSQSLRKIQLKTQHLWTAALFATSLLLSACQSDIVHLRPMAELNQRAQTMMAAGDYTGAIARLESAHDLNPAEPNTTYNLALAYQAADKPLQAIPLIADLLDKHPAGAPAEGALKKTLGILWEARGDQLQKAAQALAAEPKKDSKPSLAAAAPNNERQVEADRAYTTALDYYRQALQNKDLQDADSVKQQADALEARHAKQATAPL
jgi:tetratricopeptide (TPR) repeat protein